MALLLLTRIICLGTKEKGLFLPHISGRLLCQARNAIFSARLSSVRDFNPHTPEGLLNLQIHETLKRALQQILDTVQFIRKHFGRKICIP